MTGLIWFVQIVHYPLFGAVSKEVFIAYEASHKSLTTAVVAPLMLIELLTSLALFGLSSPFSRAFLFVNLGLVLIIWLSTAFVQVPLHNQLSLSFSEDNIRRLVNTNWIRTLSWTVKTAWAFWIVVK